MPFYANAGTASPVKAEGLNRQPVPYSRIGKNMVNAIVAIEDDRYWVHGAIDLRGTVRAAVNDLRHKAVQGGSTIAQQYVKNHRQQADRDPGRDAGRHGGGPE